MQLRSMDYFCCPACNSNLQLIIEKQTGTEIIEGMLECLACKRRFDIKDGLPNLFFSKTLDQITSEQQIWHDQHAQQYDRNVRRWMLGIGAWEFALWETRARRQLVNRLELKKDASVLETGVGTGSALPIIAKQIGGNGQLDGLDISSRMLKIARQKMNAKGIQVELTQANASYLPYKTENFDAVLHIGGLNQFAEKKRAIEEMSRVAKSGSKIVICDEGLAPSKEKTWLGRRILKRSVLFANKPPVNFVPNGAKALRVYWVWQGTFWVIEFRKQ